MRAVELALGVAVGGSAVAQTPEVRPGQPGWTRTDRGCHVWNAVPQPGMTASWTGACQNGRAPGPGTKVWRYDGKTMRYDGGMRDGKMHGRGTLVEASGPRYDGEWRDGVADGIGAHYHADSGETLNGLWRKGCFRDGDRRAAVGVPLSSCR